MDPKLWEELPRFQNPKAHFVAFLNELRTDDIEVLYEAKDEYTFYQDKAREYKLQYASTAYTTYSEFLNFVLQAESIEEIDKAVETFELKMPDMIVITSRLEEIIDTRIIR